MLRALTTLNMQLNSLSLCFSKIYLPWFIILFYLALALKGIEYEYRAVHLLKDGGEQVSIIYEFIHCPFYHGHEVACIFHFSLPTLIRH